LATYTEVVGHDDPFVQLQLALSLGEFMEADATGAMELLKKVSLKYGDEPLFREAILSSIYGKENQFLTLIKESKSSVPEMVSLLDEVIEHTQIKNQLVENSLTEEEINQYIMGKDRKSTRLNSSHVKISYAVFCLKKKKKKRIDCYHYNLSRKSARKAAMEVSEICEEDLERRLGGGHLKR